MSLGAATRRAYPDVYPEAHGGTERIVATGDEEKRAANEATFRERVPYLCECDDVRCHDPIRLSAEEYESVREDGATLVIAPGHSSEGDVLEQYAHYHVVRKQEAGGELARALDPRAEEA